MARIDMRTEEIYRSNVKLLYSEMSSLSFGKNTMSKNKFGECLPDMCNGRCSSFSPQLTSQGENPSAFSVMHKGVRVLNSHKLCEIVNYTEDGKEDGKYIWKYD